MQTAVPNAAKVTMLLCGTIRQKNASARENCQPWKCKSDAMECCQRNAAKIHPLSSFQVCADGALAWSQCSSSAAQHVSAHQPYTSATQFLQQETNIICLCRQVFAILKSSPSMETHSVTHAPVAELKLAAVPCSCAAATVTLRNQACLIADLWTRLEAAPGGRSLDQMLGRTIGR